MQIKNVAFVKSSAELSQCPDPSLPEYAFIGRSNVGKSSLINMLTNKKRLAKTSGTPGKTQLINHFIVDESWYLVDLPGYGYARLSKDKRKTFSKLISTYLEKRKNLVCVFMLIDSRHSPLKNDLEFLEWLGKNQVPFIIVFTKIDKLSSSQLNKNMQAYKNELMKSWEELPKSIATSSTTATGREEILQLIEKTNAAISLDNP